MTTLTPTSLQVFLAYAKDACNWNGIPLVGGNVGGSKEERGNLTQLKRAGLITTDIDDGNTWITFTAAGRALAAEHGIEIRVWTSGELGPEDQARAESTRRYDD